MSDEGKRPGQVPAQEQDRQPGTESGMTPRPQYSSDHYAGSGKLDGKVALITGGDSGIGRAVAVLFAREGADIAISYLEEDNDASETHAAVQREGRRCLLIPGDLASDAHCTQVVDAVIGEFGALDILVNNAAVQYPQRDLTAISREQLEKTFATNVYPYFRVTARALEHLPRGGAIINTTSVTAYRGSDRLMDYAATKGAIVAFTRSLASSLVERGIRVNAVAPGPIWTPLIPSSFTKAEVEAFGQESPMGRPGQPEEVAPSYVFLASADSSYMSGQVLHPNGGEVVGS